MQRLQVAAGVTRPARPKPRPKVTYHELRHTAGTIMLTASKPLPVVARQLGHASSKITAAIYEHLLDDALLDEALGAFDDARIARAGELEPEEVANPLE